jgi:hypothetical protein
MFLDTSPAILTQQPRPPRAGAGLRGGWNRLTVVTRHESHEGESKRHGHESIRGGWWHSWGGGSAVDWPWPYILSPLVMR